VTWDELKGLLGVAHGNVKAAKFEEAYVGGGIWVWAQKNEKNAKQFHDICAKHGLQNDEEEIKLGFLVCEKLDPYRDSNDKPMSTKMASKLGYAMAWFATLELCSHKYASQAIRAAMGVEGGLEGMANEYKTHRAKLGRETRGTKSAQTRRLRAEKETAEKAERDRQQAETDRQESERIARKHEERQRQRAEEEKRAKEARIASLRRTSPPPIPAEPEREPEHQPAETEEKEVRAETFRKRSQGDQDGTLAAVIPDHLPAHEEQVDEKKTSAEPIAKEDVAEETSVEPVAESETETLPTAAEIMEELDRIIESGLDFDRKNYALSRFLLEMFHRLRIKPAAQWTVPEDTPIGVPHYAASYTMIVDENRNVTVWGPDPDEHLLRRHLLDMLEIAEALREAEPTEDRQIAPAEDWQVEDKAHTREKSRRAA
jgi:hypothetical protein